MTAVGALRVEFVPNVDDDYPWPWSAFLQEWDGTEWLTLDSRDAETPAEALEEVRAHNPVAEDLKVKVPRGKWAARAHDGGTG